MAIKQTKREKRISDIYLLLNTIGRLVDPTPIIKELLELHGYSQTKKA